MQTRGKDNCGYPSPLYQLYHSCAVKVVFRTFLLTHGAKNFKISTLTRKDKRTVSNLDVKILSDFIKQKEGEKT
jgi:hypothetical protein